MDLNISGIIRRSRKKDLEKLKKELQMKTIKEIAEFANISKTSVYRLVKKIISKLKKIRNNLS